MFKTRFKFRRASRVTNTTVQELIRQSREDQNQLQTSSPQPFRLSRQGSKRGAKSG